jgi:hypothetical protein
MLYSIYYYQPGINSSVILYAIATDIEKIIELLKKNFYNIQKYHNNCITCNIKNTIPYKIHKYCILWISSHNENIELEYKGLSCNQPYNTIDIMQMI